MALTLGDPDALGWGVTLLYLGTAWRARAAAHAVPPLPIVAPRYWLGLALLLLALGINKQADGQTILIYLLRRLSRLTGWYAERRLAEAAALIGGLIVAAAALLAAWRWTPRTRDALTAFAGVLLLIAYVALRAARILHVEHPEPGHGGFVLRDVIEPAGILLVLLGAELAIRRRRLTG